VTDKLLAEWFWIDRWDGSRAVLLPMEAQGIYRAMLSQAWRRGAKLPVDLDEVQILIRCRPSEWARSWPLVAPFWIERDGHLVNETQIEVYNETVRIKEGKIKGGRARSDQASRAGSGRFEPAGSPAEHPAGVQQTAPADVQPPSPSPSPSPSPVVTTYQKNLPVVVVPEPSDADAARGELKSALSDLRQRFPSFAFDADQAILDNPRFHSTGGGICRIETCTNPGLLRATAAKVRAYGKQPKPKTAARGAPAWDLGTTRYTEAEILAWDDRLGPKPSPTH